MADTQSAASKANVVRQIAALTGLDDETVSTQLVPFLDTFKQRRSLVHHLEELLGPGARQRQFIDAYADLRFPNVSSSPAAAAAAGAGASSTAAQRDEGERVRLQRPSSPSGAGASTSGHPVGTNRRAGKTKFPSKLPPVRQVEGQASFGGVPAYRKGQESSRNDEAGRLLFGGDRDEDTAVLSTPTPFRKEESLMSDSSSKIDTAASTPLGGDSRVATPDSQERRQLTAASSSISPSEAMKEVAAALALLRGDSDLQDEAAVKPCFCQARKHSVHPYAPLCMSCGLILCAVVSPSPLAVSSVCPSCAEPMLDEQSRGVLTAQLDAKIARLTHDHEEHAARVRYERQLARSGESSQAELFPELHGTTVIFPSAQGAIGADYNYFTERRRQMDVAMGRRIDDPATQERRIRVLRLGAKEPAGAKKKKKKPQPQSRSEDMANAAGASAATPSLSDSAGAGAAGSIAADARIDIEQAGADESHPDDDGGTGEYGLQDVVRFDDELDSLAPVSDVLDDGYQRRWAASPTTTQGNAINRSAGTSRVPAKWEPQDASRTYYVPLAERPIRRKSDMYGDAHDEDEQSGEGAAAASAAVAAAAARHVPGSSSAAQAKGGEGSRRKKEIQRGKPTT